MWLVVTRVSPSRPPSKETFRGPSTELQLVVTAATRVQRRLRASLADRNPQFQWSTEYRIGRRPVDVAGERERELVLVELEWRRADPADNTATLFRHLASETLGAEVIHVRQLFTTYYDLASGDVSSKRKNAEFVGDRVAAVFDHVDYEAVTLSLDPPKRGGDLPVDWTETVEATAASLEW
jgi:hypothetical protein